MAGHSKFKNIQHRKGAQDKKRAKIFTKLVREIITAAKIGGADPLANPRLRNSISAARSHNLPKERIDRALAQASDPTGDNDYVEIRYEGFLPGGIAIIVETLTDNKNRTVSDVRSCFSKYGGNLSESGTVTFMFEHVGKIIYPVSVADSDQILSAAVEIDVKDVISDESEHVIYTEIESFSESLEYLTKIFDTPIESELEWKALNNVLVEDEERAIKLFKLIDALEENDDVQKVFSNYELSEELYKKLDLIN